LVKRRWDAVEARQKVRGKWTSDNNPNAFLTEKRAIAKRLTEARLRKLMAKRALQLQVAIAELRGDGRCLLGGLATEAAEGAEELRRLILPYHTAVDQRAVADGSLRLQARATRRYCAVPGGHRVAPTGGTDKLSTPEQKYITEPE
jgi:hypothetical protein